MADKVDMKPAASSLLPVAVEKKKQKQAPPPSPAVQMVSEWALRTGVIFAVSFALACCAAPFQLQVIIQLQLLFVGLDAATCWILGWVYYIIDESN